MRNRNIEFIRASREDLTVFGSDLDWHADHWKAGGISFGNMDQTTRKLDPANTMKRPFLEFAKAYVRYQQGHNPTAAKCEMRALKCLERALVDCGEGPDVQCVNSAVLDRAAVLARVQFSRGGAYQVGRQIARLATFLFEMKMIPYPLDWKNPIARQTDTVRTGMKAREEREKKLPSTEVLNAIADIFANNPQESRDNLHHLHRSNATLRTIARFGGSSSSGRLRGLGNKT